MPSITFSVSYTLNEYLSFVQEHAAAVLAKQAGAKGKLPRSKPSLLSRGLISIFASVMFFFKKRRMPICEFTIDEQRIVRNTALGQLVVLWPEIVAIHRYSQGYLVEKCNGAMPLPFRCLSPQQASVLGGF
jgi:hypothetical protein